MNPWVKLQTILSPGTKQIVTVTAVNNDGTSIVQLRDSTSIRVAGDSVAVDDKAFIQGGRLLGKAPDLPSEAIDV